MITIYRYEQLGHANHGWLNARHHFSFASYQNANRVNFGALRVINDDIIKAHSGFAPHPHEDMEIITYVRSGAITHKDSKGNEGKTKAGDIQVMSAGSGIRHSEMNNEDEETNLYQIWIIPNKLGVAPRWDAKEFPKEPVKDALPLLVSGDKKAPLFIYQDAHIYGGNILKGTTISHPIKNQVYLLVSKGEIEVEGNIIKKGDGAEITDVSHISITAISDCEILIIDVPNL
ncbi:MAG: pirin family protein [Rickettsiales bacterium]|nr:pirin family protein [Rickettsiales bacterium]